MFVVERDRQSVQCIRRRCRARFQDHGRLHGYPCWYVLVCTYISNISLCVCILVDVCASVSTYVCKSICTCRGMCVLKMYFRMYICTEPSDDVLCHALSYSHCHALNSNTRCALSIFHYNLNLSSLYRSQYLLQQPFKRSLNPSWTAQNYQV